MIELTIVSVIAFFAVAIIVLALGLLLRDLFGLQKEEQERLELLPPEPKSGFLAKDFFYFIEETGLPLEASTALLIILGSGLILMTIPLVTFDHLPAAIACFGIGLALPMLVFFVVRWWRCRRMRNALPETLQIVADAVRSGYTLAESCQMVVREVKGPLQGEFAHASYQFKLGHHPLQIMKRMVRRIPLPEFRVFATAVIVHQRAGGNLSLLTERMAHVARDRQEVRGHLMAVTAGSRLSAAGMIFGSIAAMIVLAVLEPDYVGAFVTHPLGPTMLTTALLLMGTGIVWVWRLLKENF